MNKTILYIVGGAVVVGATALIVAQERPHPSDQGKGSNGAEFTISSEKGQAGPRQLPMAVQRLETHRLAEGTQLGRPGDLLVTFTGQGFVTTDYAPHATLTEKLVLRNLEVSRDGKQLFVVIPARLQEDVKRASFREIVIQQSGGTSEFARLVVEASPEQLLRVDSDAPEVIVVHRDSFFVREDKKRQ